MLGLLIATLRLLALSLPFLLAVSAQAAAAGPSAWPERPVRVIVPFAAGGGTDLIARPWAEKLSQFLGQQFIIDNRGGASGMIGAEAVNRAAPDGYTLLIGTTSTMATVTQLQKISFDPETGFTPVARLADLFLGFAIHPSVPATTMREFVDYARRNPGKVAFGTSGVGGSHHLHLEMLKQRAGVDILHVPYRGSADALTDLLSGTVQAMIEVVIFPHVKAGKLRLLAVMSETRDPVFPDTPTMDEAGFPGVAMPSWVGLYGPTGLPREIVMRLNKAVAEIGTTPDMTTRLLNADAVPHAQAPEDVAKSLRERIEVSRRIIATANIKPE